MKRRIIQFGHQLNNLFVFTPFEEEDDWGDSVEPTLLALQFADGSYRALGFDQSRKPQKVITKRFTLYSKDLIQELDKNNTKDICVPLDKSNYMTKFIDYMYRGLRGGVKRLYAVMEDGSIRYTWAEATTIPYQRSFTDPNKWATFSVDFILHDPYWYEIKDPNIYIYEDIRMPQLINPCFQLDDSQIKPTVLISINQNKCWDDCGYVGVILKNEAMTGYIGDECLKETGCLIDPCTEMIYSRVSGNTFLEICVLGSAGADKIIATISGDFLNPSIQNTINGHTIQYTGTLTSSQYITIDLGSSLAGDKDDYDIESNIPDFNLNNLNINNDDLWKLEIGVNPIKVTGGQSNNSLFGFRHLNKYHN
jgi:hypothetical protein